MPRLLLISLLCAILIACSSDDSDALKEWFYGQGLAVSYGKQFEEFEISLKGANFGSDTSAFMVSSYAALGNVNGVEHTLYFGMDSLPEIWRLRPDTVFYKGVVPDEHKELEATIYWLEENEVEHDTAWLKVERKIFTNADSANINIEWKDSAFFISLPDGLPKLKSTVKLKLNSNNSVLRIAPPNIADIPGLLRVAQKIKVDDNECKQCLHAGARESLFVLYETGDIKNIDKTVVFAQLILPKSDDSANKNELENFPIPVYMYGEKGLEDYRIDSVYVREYGHPNFIFGKNDSLKLQVTGSLRSDTLGFTLRLGNPILQPDSLYFYNYIAARPAYSRYNFDSILEKAKLRLWFADYGDKK
ncbi:MAG: hypothetical protein LBQ87_01525 [Candidatus Fibromonas sp.]|jgi:hypothetical protein|nr:hypothetical protein [Candidatus Fibromonas sp.]